MPPSPCRPGLDPGHRPPHFAAKRALPFFLLLPSPLWAEVCDKISPGWNGTDRTALTQALAFWTSPWTLPLVALIAAAGFTHHRSFALAATALGALIALLLLNWEDGEIQAAALREGCVGPSWLLILTLLAPALLLIRRS